VSVEDHEPGEILRKLPEIVRELMQLDAGALASAAHCDHPEHHEPDLRKALAPGEPDPLEEKFRHPVTLAMYRQAKAAADVQGRAIVSDLGDYLAGIGRPV
jgi:hypothetical protein